MIISDAAKEQGKLRVKVMLTVKGKVENGAIFLLEPLGDSYEGKEVIDLMLNKTAVRTIL